MSKRRSKSPLKPVVLEEAKIGFVGAGKIADCLIQGLVKYGQIQPSKIHVAAPSTKNTPKFKDMGCHTTKRSYDIFGKYDCEIVFLCLHGTVINECYKDPSRPYALTTNYIPTTRHPIYILSLISGCDCERIKKVLLNPDTKDKYSIEIHRIVMNPGCAFGLGVCAIDVEPDSPKLDQILRVLLSKISKLEYIPESQMDAACALSGAGLAFVFYFIKALADGAVKMGLEREVAIKLAAKTLNCAAQSVLESGKHPGQLRDNVCSPQGAAIYGIHVLDKADVASGIAAAVEAASNRAIELNKVRRSS